ncbi:hypothetical protein [Myxococcus stipitatus]|uniref:hypothetical protein n=1 Tax=Myxococcus stipitatus TaxID=83455 RepID=UPI0030D60DDE
MYVEPLLAGTFLVLAVICALAVWYKVRQIRTIRAAWRAFAASRGWSYAEPDRLIEVQGLHRGRQVSVATERRGSGRFLNYVVVMRVDLSDVLPNHLHLESERLRDVLHTWLGQPDEKVGDPALDSALHMKNVDPMVRTLLGEDPVREHLLRAHRAYTRISLIGGLLEAEHPTVPAATFAMEEQLAPALALADVLETATVQTAAPRTHGPQRERG